MKEMNIYLCDCLRVQEQREVFKAFLYIKELNRKQEKERSLSQFRVLRGFASLFLFWQGSVHTEQTFHCSLNLFLTSWSLWLTLLFKEQVLDPHDLWLHPEKHSKELAELCHLIPTLLDWLVWFPCCSRNSQESSPAPQFESICSLLLSLLYGPTLTSIHDYWKNHSFDYLDQS